MLLFDGSYTSFPIKYGGHTSEKFSQNNKSADIRPFDLVSYVKDANDNTNIPTSTGTMDPESAFAWIVVVSLWFWAYFKVRQVLR